MQHTLSFALFAAVSLAVGCSSPREMSDAEDNALVTNGDDDDCTAVVWGEPPSSFDGVEGTYSRVGRTPENRMKAMTLSNHVANPSGHISSEARYERVFACSDCSKEVGVAQLMPVNPAINPMLSFSTNGFGPGADVRDIYNVLALERSGDTIRALCLYEANEGRAFIMRR